MNFKDLFKKEPKVPGEVTVAQAAAFMRALEAPDHELTRNDWMVQVTQAFMNLPNGADSYIASLTVVQLEREGAYLNYLSGDYGDKIYMPETK